MKKVLHITNWYPNKWNDVEALFVKQQFDLFSEVTETRLLHVEVRQDNCWFKYEKVKYSEKETGYYVLTKVRRFRIIEILTTFLLLWALFQNKVKQYDLLHFHIAYPLLTYYHIWKKFIKIPVVISEHWSAYHFNFFMPKGTGKLDRLKKIFHHGLPLITVSKALLNDIHTFTGTKAFPSYVIPNVIDLDVYRYHPANRGNTKPTFFIVNLWRSIKNPYPMLEAFANLAKNGMDFELRIGGYGPILEDMKHFVIQQGLDRQTVFLGKMYKEEIAKEMNQTDAYLFASEYETFSAVCAQALSCGCPLIGPAIPAIMEYAGDKEMISLEANDQVGWIKAIDTFLKNKDRYPHEKIAQKVRAFLSHERIKDQYKAVVYEYTKN